MSKKKKKKIAISTTHLPEIVLFTWSNALRGDIGRSFSFSFSLSLSFSFRSLSRSSKLSILTLRFSVSSCCAMRHFERSTSSGHGGCYEHWKDEIANAPIRYFSARDWMPVTFSVVSTNCPVYLNARKTMSHCISLMLQCAHKLDHFLEEYSLIGDADLLHLRWSCARMRTTLCTTRITEIEDWCLLQRLKTNLQTYHEREHSNSARLPCGDTAGGHHSRWPRDH